LLAAVGCDGLVADRKQPCLTFIVSEADLIPKAIRVEDIETLELYNRMKGVYYDPDKTGWVVKALPPKGAKGPYADLRGPFCIPSAELGHSEALS
jgi:hypothetical protein